MAHQQNNQLKFLTVLAALLQSIQLCTYAKMFPLGTCSISDFPRASGTLKGSIVTQTSKQMDASLHSLFKWSRFKILWAKQIKML